MKFRFNKEEKFLIKLLVLVAIGMLFRGYGLWLTDKVEQETIEKAVLVESNDKGYTLSFDGEEYWYTFD